VCPKIACVSFTNNQFPIGGLFSTASFRLSPAVDATRCNDNSKISRSF
jgi:hypothetical protein